MGRQVHRSNAPPAQIVLITRNASIVSGSIRKHVTGDS